MTKAAMTPGLIRFIGASAANNGITALIGNTEHIHPGNTITVSYNGSVGEAFYQTDKFWASDDINVFYPKFDLNEQIALFLLPLIKQKGKRYSYSNKWTKEAMEADVLSIPVVEAHSRKIDFQYMESFIWELESARVRELGKWLVASGLDDYRLTPSEQKSLDDWRGGKVETTVRKVTEIFEVSNTHCVLGEWVNGRLGKVPYVTASSCNNSVSSYIDYKDEFMDRGNAIVIGGKTFVVTYQSEDFFSNDSHNLVLHLKDTRHRSREVYLYLIAAINVAMRSKYSWGDSISYKKIQKDMIAVPVMSSGEIDFNFMAYFVRAIIKLVIRGVMEWKDQEIITTKKAQVPLPYNKSAMESPEECDWERRMAAFEDSDA